METKPSRKFLLWELWDKPTGVSPTLSLFLSDHNHPAVRRSLGNCPSSTISLPVMSHRFAALQMFIFCSGSQRARNRQLDFLQYWFARMCVRVYEFTLPEVRTFSFGVFSSQGIVAQNAQKKTAKLYVCRFSCTHTSVCISLFTDHDSLSASFRWL